MITERLSEEANESMTPSSPSGIVIRPIRPDDADGLIEFHDSLSEVSRYFRFFSLHPSLPRAEAVRFADVDGDDRMAFVAEVDGHIVGVGRYDRLLLEPAVAELAFAVADDLQGHGIGTALLCRLARDAPAHGIETFCAWVLPTNHRMLDLFSDVAGRMHCDFDGGVVRVRFDIASIDFDEP